MGKRILAALLAILLFVGEFGATKITGAAGGPASHDPFEQSEYISADNNSDSSISNHPVSRDGVSAEDISGNSISAKDISGNDVSANDISGNDISDSHIFHEQISEEDLSANDSLMEDLSGNDISANEVSGNDISANEVSGNDITSNEVSGNDISGNDGAGEALYGVVIDKTSEGSLTQKPARPQFGYGPDNKQKIILNTTTLSLKMTADSGCKIYYTLNGKAPTFKKGTPGKDALLYSQAVTIQNQPKVTVKAIAVNGAGLCSPVMEHTFIFQPPVKKLTLSAVGSTRSTNPDTGVVTVQVNLVRGKKLQLLADYEPSFAINTKVAWSVISQPAQAGNKVRVNSKGQVTADSGAVAGIYKVQAMLHSNPAVKAVIQVRIVTEATVSSMKMSKKTVDLMTVGKTSASCDLFKDYLKVQSSKKVAATDLLWVSSNTQIATVDKNGVVKTVAGAAGSVVIQVTAKDGSGRQAKITVRVRQQATAVTIQGENVVGSGKKIRLYATVAPSPAASQKVSWSVTGWPKGADSKQVKIDQKGNFSATKKAMSGTYTICATAADGSGKSANYTVRVQAPVKTLLVDAPSKVTLYRVTGGDSIGATVSKSFSVEARTSEDAVCKNLEVISDTPGLVQASYNAAKNLIVVKATGQGTGTATITCKTTDGSNIRKAFKVTVVNPPSSITIQLPNGSTGDLAVGYKHKCNVILGTKFGDPGKVNVQCYVTDTKGKEIQNLSFSKDVLNISGKEKVNQSFRVCAKVEGELKLSTYTTCKTRSRITSMILKYEGEDILGEPILKKEASPHRFRIWVKQGGTEYCQASQSTLSTTSDYSITVNSDDMKLEYDSKNKKAEVKSATPGRYKITVKALDGSGISKSYYVRYR